MTQAQALTILKTGANVFLTGEPGSGKTHTIREYVSYLRSFGVEPAITASTGIAATHIHGQTIHSWSGIGIKNYLSAYDLDALMTRESLSKRIKNTKILIIDEVSMLSASTLAMVDQVCRSVRHSAEAFGGIQVVLVGDFFQLPPVGKADAQSQFAYESASWRDLKLITCYLTEQHRQEDLVLLDLLAAIRRNEIEEVHHEQLQSRIVQKGKIQEQSTQLYTKNISVDALNDAALATIPGVGETYHLVAKGRASLVESLKKGCLSPEVLILKKDAIVMCTKNNPSVGFVNGTLGRVIDFQPQTKYPIIKTRDGRVMSIEPMDWTIEEDGTVKARITQIPLRLAWAITVHKSQGLTLESAVMDLSDVFEYGQGYVALSRVRSMQGLHLLGYNAQALLVHPEVLARDAQFRTVSEKAELYFESMNQKQIEELHLNFMKAIGGSRALAKKVKSEKHTTQDQTHELFLKGYTLEKIAKVRQLTVGTVLDHVAFLVKNGKLSRAEVLRLCPPELKKALPLIHATFDALGDEKLTPVFSKLKGKYTYDDLKFARTLYETTAS